MSHQIPSRTSSASSPRSKSPNAAEMALNTTNIRTSWMMVLAVIRRSLRSAGCSTPSASATCSLS